MTIRNFVLELLLLGAVFQGSSSQYHPNYPWETVPGEGKRWLSWSVEQRQSFTLGYLWGYDEAFGGACVAYFDATPSTGTGPADSPLQKCKLREPQYSKGADYYEAAITAYYQKYPSDVDLWISWLFLAFSDSENKTPEEIHAAWANHHPL